MKKIIVLMLSLLLLTGSVCHADIIPSRGAGQIGYAAVVLCDSLTLYRDQSTGSSAITSLRYGDRIIVISRSDGWAKCTLGDSEDSTQGYVKSDYLAIDPAWYKASGSTPVYAWNDTSAPKVALLSEGTTLPILKDDGNWLLISLRGAAGWISNPDRTPGQGGMPIVNSGSSSNSSSESSSGSSSGGNSQKEEDIHWFTVYARDGSTADLHWVGGAMYEDERTRTYVKDDSDGYFYCITTDKTYAVDPTMWTGEAYGENEFPEDYDWDEDYDDDYYNDYNDYDDDDKDYDDDTWFTVYARDGSTAYIHPVGGAMYEDGRTRTYVKDDSDGYYYCITTDVTYAIDPTMWTGEAYGENEFPDDVD